LHYNINIKENPKEDKQMVKIISGEKGKGKTKILLDKANTEIKSAKGTIVYLDKDNQHMFELNNKIRLINVKDYSIENASEFVGFICGIISQDNDLETIYLDSFLKVSYLTSDEADKYLIKLDEISQKFNVNIVVSFSQKSDQVSDFVKSKIVAAL
jgi:hypothetical protein